MPGLAAAGTPGCHLVWRNGVLLTSEPGGLVSARVRLLRKRESHPIVLSCTAESALKTAEKRFGLKFFDWLMSGSLKGHNFMFQLKIQGVHSRVLHCQ